MQFINWLIIAILAAALVPSIMDTLIAVDTTTWPAIAVLVWDNLPVFIIIGVLFLILRKTGIMGKGGPGV
ncbi:MAG: hypothetical protein FVQ79_07425 [Planctomycetes bacterium]|nr:hypothetical protein [Planctomycetota bacterium]